MSRKRRGQVVCVLGVAFALTVVAMGANAGSSNTAQAKATIDANFAKLPLSFEPNVGQSAPEVKFLSRGRGFTLTLSSDEAAVSMIKPSSAASLEALLRANSMGAGALDAKQFSQQVKAVLDAAKLDAHNTAAVRIKLDDANTASRIEGLEQQQSVTNYYQGKDPAKWHTRVANYARVRYRQIYPGIDLIYYGNHQELEYDFVLAPGADPARVKMVISGADRVEVSKQGDLVMKTAAGDIHMARPLIYQSVGKERKVVDGGYVLVGRRGKDAARVGIRVASYDRSKPLVVDPVLVYSTFMGGTLAAGNAVAVDAGLNAYVAGYTWTPNCTGCNPFPSPTHTYGTGPTTAGVINVLVAKLNPTGTALSYSTVIGGTVFQDGLAVAVDAANNAYVTGFTNSTDYPTNVGPAASAGGDVFVTKLTSTGTLSYSTFVGGNSFELGNSIAVTPSCTTNCNAYIAGETLSANFPTTIGPAFSDGADAFVVKLTPTGTISYATLVGGTTGGASAASIAVDGSGAAYIAGSTSASDFPVTIGAFHGANDGFVTKFGPTGTRVYSTLLGGAGVDWASGIAIKQGCALNCNAYVVGGTSSRDFPITAGAPIKSVFASGIDVYVAQLSATGAIVYSTLYGGQESYTFASGIAVDEFGKAFITGEVEGPFLPTVKPLRLFQEEHGDLFRTTDRGSTQSALGWPSYIGSVVLIAVDSSTTPSTIYAATTRNGLYVSTDGGSTFQQTALSETRVEGLAIDPTTSPHTVFVGTPTGMVMLTDVGTTIANTAFDGILVGAIGVNVIGTTSVITALTVSGSTFTIMNSSDHGNTWTASSGIPPRLFPIHFTQHAGTAVELVGTNGGVFKSTNRGVTWSPTNLNFAYVTAMGTDNKTSPPTDYATGLGTGAIKSTDDFTTLTFSSVPALNFTGNSFAVDQSTTPSTIYLGGGGIGLADFFKSTDGGNNFVAQPANGDGHCCVQAIAKDPASSTIYFSNFDEVDPFVAELNEAGNAFVFSTALGGSVFDFGNGIAVTPNGLNGYVAGQTFSADFPIKPNPGAYQVGFGGFTNAFATRISLPLSATNISSDPDFKSVDAIASDGSKLYVSGISTATSATRVWSVPIAGGSATALYSVPWTASGGTSALSLAVIPSNLFWIDPKSGPAGDTQILKAPDAGSGTVSAIYTASTATTKIAFGSGLATDGSNIYAADEQGGGILKMTSAGASVTQIGAARYTVGSTDQHPNFITVASGTVFIADSGLSAASLPPQVLSLPAAGGSYKTLYSGAPLNCPSGITFGDGVLLVTDRCAKTVWVMPTSGGKPVSLVGAPLVSPQQAVFFGGSLYITDNSTAGRVFKVSGF